MEGGSSGEARTGNLYVPIPTSQPSKVEQKPREAIPLLPKIESSGPGETNADLHDTQTPLISTPTLSSPLIPKTAATESTEETIVSKEVQVDDHPNASIPPPPIDDGAQYVTVNNFENPQVNERLVNLPSKTSPKPCLLWHSYYYVNYKAMHLHLYNIIMTKS